MRLNDSRSICSPVYSRGFRARTVILFLVQGRIVFGDAVTTADTETNDSHRCGLKSALLGMAAAHSNGNRLLFRNG